ncbi:MAG TPA: hypothetical protein VI564_09415 [Candidatus Nanoarchaeia archaeon]|nr:hypothetical protein [Candidatus Nanoarchaeia archaeon]
MISISEVSAQSSAGQDILGQIYGLRLEVYKHLGWFFDSKHTHLLKDEFESIPTTTHFAILEDEKVIGAHRMTKYSKEFELPYIKDGLNKSIFGIGNPGISEASRLLIKQDRKYPGCAKQLLFNTTKYELENNSEAVVSIGFSDHVDFFEYIGYRVVNNELSFTLDKRGDDQIVRKGTPIIALHSTLNSEIELDKYENNRRFVVIKNG